MRKSRCGESKCVTDEQYLGEQCGGPHPGLLHPTNIRRADVLQELGQERKQHLVERYFQCLCGRVSQRAKGTGQKPQTDMGGPLGGLVLFVEDLNLRTQW